MINTVFQLISGGVIDIYMFLLQGNNQIAGEYKSRYEGLISVLSRVITFGDNRWCSGNPKGSSTLEE